MAGRSRKIRSGAAPRTGSPTGGRPQPPAVRPGAQIASGEPALWAASRAGARAGRGFRVQDAVSTLLLVEGWAGESAVGVRAVVPEGLEDATLLLGGGGRAHAQVKSRRASIGDYSRAELVRLIREVAGDHVRRSRAGMQDATALVLERRVIGLAVTGWNLPVAASPDFEAVVRDTLTRDAGWLPDGDSDGSEVDDVLRQLRVVVVSDPVTSAVAVIARVKGIAESVAELVVAAVRDEVGQASDDNFSRSAADASTLSVSDVDRVLDEVLAQVDLNALDEAATTGTCVAMDWTHPMEEPTFYEGVDVLPGHVAAGLLVPRTGAVDQVWDRLADRRAVMIVGPSGAGKSALALEAAYESRHEVRWQEVRRMDVRGASGRDAVAMTVARVAGMRPGKHVPVGVFIDDAGRHDPVTLNAMLGELARSPNVVVIVTTREEDVFPVPHLAALATVRPTLDERLAEELWRRLRDDEATEWAGWREPFERAAGLLLEYVSLLTTGRRLDEVVTEQVQARARDPLRHKELDVARLVATAHQFGASLRATAVAAEMGLSPSELDTALRRLIREHLLVETGEGTLSGLHEARSAALARAANQVGQNEILIRLVRLVPADALSRFLQRALAAGADEPRLRAAAADRTAEERTAAVLTAVGAAWRADGYRRLAEQVTDVLAGSGVPANLANTATTLARVALSAELERQFMPSIRDALPKLRALPSAPDVRPLLDKIGLDVASAIATSVVRATGTNGDAGEALVSMLVAFADSGPALLGAARVELSAALLRLSAMPAARLVEAIGLVDWDTALAATDAAGPEVLLAAAARDVDWLVGLRLVDTVRAADNDRMRRQALGLVSEDSSPESGADEPEHQPVDPVASDIATMDAPAIDVVGSWVFADEELQPRAHDDVVDACRLAFALAPRARHARIHAVGPSGRTALVGPGHALADKSIPRGNLPPLLWVAGNRAHARALAIRLAAKSRTARLAVEAEIIGLVTRVVSLLGQAAAVGRLLPPEGLLALDSAVQLAGGLPAALTAAGEPDRPDELGTYPDEPDVATLATYLASQVAPNLLNADVAARRPALAAMQLPTLLNNARQIAEPGRYNLLDDPPDVPSLVDALGDLRDVAQALAIADPAMTGAMQAAARGREPRAALVHAAGTARTRAAKLLSRTAERVQSAVALTGGDSQVWVLPKRHGDADPSWPRGDLLVAVHAPDTVTFTRMIDNVAAAARTALDTPTRTPIVACIRDGALVRSLVFRAWPRLLPALDLGTNELPVAAHETPLSDAWSRMLRAARRVSALVSLALARSQDELHEAEEAALAQALTEIGDVLAELRTAADNSSAPAVLAEAVQTASTLLAAVDEDVQTAITMLAQGRGGWASLEDLQLPAVLDHHDQHPDTPTAETGAALRGMAILLTEVDVHPEDADVRIAAVTAAETGRLTPSAE